MSHFNFTGLISLFRKCKSTLSSLFSNLKEIQSVKIIYLLYPRYTNYCGSNHDLSFSLFTSPFTAFPKSIAPNDNKQHNQMWFPKQQPLGPQNPPREALWREADTIHHLGLKLRKEASWYHLETSRCSEQELLSWTTSLTLAEQSSESCLWHGYQKAGLSPTVNFFM